MALINCPNCGATISDTANHCPKCGVQLKKTGVQKRNKTALYALLSVLGALILIVGGTIAYSDYSEKKAAKEAKIRAEQERQEEQQRQAEMEARAWEQATVDGTETGYQRYLDEHANGRHASEAQAKLDSIERLKLSYDEEESVRNAISTFLYGAANGYEEEMLQQLSPRMDSFLGKTSATKVDAVSFMRHLHAGDVFSVSISLDTDDIQVQKTLNASGKPVYSAEFAYDQRIDREDTSLETFASMKGSAILNENFKICSLSLKKLSGY